MRFEDYDTRLAAYAVIVDSDERLLLTWYNGSRPKWTLPGGEVEFEESVEAAVVREVHEETGYEVLLGAPLTTWSFTNLDGPRPYKSVGVMFTATIEGGRLGTVEVGGTTDFAEWVKVSAVEGLEPRAEIIDVGLDAWRRTWISRSV